MLVSPRTIFTTATISSSLAPTQLKAGDRFLNKAQFISRLQMWSASHGYSYRTTRSSTNRFKAVCRNSECKWVIHARFQKKIQQFAVTTIVAPHTCIAIPAIPAPSPSPAPPPHLISPIASRSRSIGRININTHKRQNLSCNVVGLLLKDTVTNNPESSIKVLKDMLIKQHNIEVPYHTVWRARRGLLEEIRENNEAKVRGSNPPPAGLVVQHVQGSKRELLEEKSGMDVLRDTIHSMNNTNTINSNKRKPNWPVVSVLTQPPAKKKRRCARCNLPGHNTRTCDPSKHTGGTRDGGAM